MKFNTTLGSRFRKTAFYFSSSQNGSVGSFSEAPGYPLQSQKIPPLAFQRSKAFRWAVFFVISTTIPAALRFLDLRFFRFTIFSIYDVRFLDVRCTIFSIYVFF